MHRLAASGEHCYGRLSGKMPGLMLSYAMQLFSKGLAPATTAAP
jgi:hypothetical protein